MTKSFVEGNDPLAYPRAMHQIVDADGKRYQAYGTHNLWVGKHAEFTPPRDGNTVTPFTTGEEYFARLSEAIAGADSEIWIAGWQINWDVHLVPGERLFDALLKAAAKPNMQIYVMPWEGSSHVPTYAKETKLALELINDEYNKVKVHVALAPAMPDESTAFFTHHQKHVVIDRKIAFVGGMDLAYGRRDTAAYDLLADLDGRASLERYNGCVAHILPENASNVLNPLSLNTHGSRSILDQRKDFLAKIKQPQFSQTSTSFNGLTLDPSCQPRMPWQDSHVEIEGPAALDIALNFAIRWNAISADPKLELPPAASSVKGSGNCIVQVLRSAPAHMCKAEYKKISSQQRNDYFAESVPSGTKEDNIYQAMMNLIERSQYYIYIENQFFVSAFGDEDEFRANTKSGPKRAVEDSNSYAENQVPYLTHAVFGDGDAAPKNDICFALGERIGKAILTKGHHPFHVTIVLPVHPEGMLCDPVVMTQVHQTMQTLVFGKYSLINQIRRHLKAKELHDLHDPDWAKGYFGDGYKEIPIEKCEEYLTLLNLRNWAPLGDRFVTEQIYVHNKMMIVDDLYAIVGSANINERSMLGSRDSELSVLVVNKTSELNDITGSGKLRSTRKFPRELRQKIWNKIFGITAGGDRAATDLKFAVDQPANPKAWQAIRALATKNTSLYEASFSYIPRSKNEDKSPVSIWPTWVDNTPKSAVSMPFNAGFWRLPQHSVNAKTYLSKVKGFITLLPLEWTKTENNKFDYHAALYSAVEPSNQRNPLEKQNHSGATVFAKNDQAKEPSEG